MELLSNWLILNKFYLKITRLTHRNIFTNFKVNSDKSLLFTHESTNQQRIYKYIRDFICIFVKDSLIRGKM